MKTKINHLIRFVWIYSVQIGLIGVALSLGIILSGFWMTMLMGIIGPMVVAFVLIAIILLLMCLLLTASMVQAVYKMVKLYRVRYM